MQRTNAFRRIAIAAIVALVGSVNVVYAGSAKEKLYEAYYLEQVQGDWAGAAKLYEKIAGDRRASDDLRGRAADRLAACREELASSDFARLMPPNALVYVELNRPGKQIATLLTKLGLIAEPNQMIAVGTKRVAISPALIREVLGIRGAAVAITGIDPQRGQPTFVTIFHPGNVEAIRGLIETGLPAGGTAVEPIAGHATFDVEGEALVTLTSRLAIAANDRALIEGVIARLNGKEKESLATNTGVVKALGNRNNALLAFFVNAKPIIPMVRAMAKAKCGDCRELAMADALLDLDSLKSVTGRVGIAQDGLSLNLALRLDEGHHNLVYNFLRAPAINRETLKCVPRGAAAFLVGALNEPGSRYSSNAPTGPDNVPIVTALDFGREIFANVTSVAVFALPPEDGARTSGPPMPDVAAAITVNDPAKSQALWTTVLGVAGLATGSQAIEGAPTEIEGAQVRTYKFPEGVTIYFTTMGNDIAIATTRSAMARTIAAKRNNRSVLTDDAFSADLAKLSSSSIKGVFVHAGRCAQIAKAFMPKEELAEAKPFLDALDNTVAALVIDQSNDTFRLSASLTGIPNIGDLVATQLMRDAERQQRRKSLTDAMRSQRWDEALAEVESQLAAHPESVRLLRAKFKILAAGKKDYDAAKACAKDLYRRIQRNANALNTFAWALLTEDQYESAFNDVALRLSTRSNELTDFENWAYLDTLAWAKFKTGDPVAAAELERKAVKRAKGRAADDLKETLAKFEAASEKAKLADGKRGG